MPYGWTLICDVVPHFIDLRLARTLQTMLLLHQHRGKGKRDSHMPTALSFWGDSTLDALPTYVYARLYTNGDTLRSAAGAAAYHRIVQ